MRISISILRISILTLFTSGATFLSAQLTVDPNTGVVTSGGAGNGYTTPNDNNSNSVFEFQEAGAAPFITNQPDDVNICPSTNTTFSVTATGLNITYQWQVSTDGGTNYNSITAAGTNPAYGGFTSATLSLTSTPLGADGNLYQVLINSTTYVCDTLTSNVSELTVEDVTDPVITVCPPDITVTVDGSCEYDIADFTGGVTATDNCTASGSITITQSPVAGTTLSGDGTVQTVTITADDGNGNTSTCSFDVTLEDTIDPVITACPPDITVTVDGSCEYDIADFTGGVTATDNCTASGSITITQSPVAGTTLSGDGTTQLVTMTADDGNGNSTTCSFTVTLDDTTDPVITVCPPDATLIVDGSCDVSLPDYTGSTTATDNCTASGSITITQSPVAGTTLSGDGTTQLVTMTADDGNGNSTTCSFTVTLDDTTDPVITVCPSDATLIVDASCDVSLPDYTGSTTATDNCTASGSITITQSPVAGTTLSGDGTTQLVTMTADDGNGNSTTCSFTVTLDDTTDPVITVCPSDATLIVDASCDISLPDYTGSTTATDNCTASGSITITQSPVAGTTLSGDGTTQLVTMTADDGNGNSTTCSFTVTLDDTTDPVITVCPPDATLIVDGSCDVSLPDYTGSTTATDNCTASGSITITQSPVAGTTLSGDGTTQLVTMTADDGNGNSTTCSFTVTLDDTTDPVITVCPPDATLIVDGSCDVSLPDYTGSTTATDNCTASGSITITQSPVAGTTLSGDGTTQLVTMTADDGNGNSTTCSFTVTLDDTTDPVITVCPSDATLIVDASCDVSLPDYTGSTTATDNCTASGSITITQSPVAGTTLSGEGTTQLVTMTADDGNGNSTTCSFTVTLDDTTDPVITVCPSDATLIVDGSCDVSLPDYTGSTTATDNCTASGSITITQSPVAGTTLSGDGTTQLVTMTADDGNGNSTTCSFTVTLDDTTDPVITVCPADASVTADASCMFTILDYTGGVTATDNCTAGGSITITQSPPAGTLVSGTQVVTMTADDGNGNTSTCSFTLTVDDTTDPVITVCQSNVTVTVDASCEYDIADYTGAVTATDNCTASGALVVTQSPAIGTTLTGDGTTQTVTMTVADANGNTSTCSFVITLDDTIDPVITVCPSDATLIVDASCDVSLPDYTGSTTATDNCTASGSITITQSPVAGTTLSGDGTTQLVTMTADDGNGNSTTCSFTVTLDDTTDPVITVCPSDATLIVDASCDVSLPDYTGSTTATDNCTASGSITITQSPVAGTTLSGDGTTQLVTMTADDGNGNSTTCSFTVTLDDTTDPVITVCPPDATLIVDGSCDVSLPDYTGSTTATDNCTASGSITITQSPVAGTTLSGDGTTQLVTMTADDGNGNSTTCSFTVTLDDTTDPVITVCPPDATLIVDGSCDVSLPDYTGSTTATDNCTASGSITITQSPVAGTTLSGDGTTQLVTMTADDGNGNSTTCSFTVTLDDTTDPVITVCPSDATLIVDASCDVSLPDYTGSTTATDNCTASGSITITQSPVAGTTLSGEGTTQLVTMTADDGNGNSTTCSFTVTLDDTTDPVITVCPSDATLIVDGSCDVSLPDYTGSTTATDNCTASGSITITQSPVAGTTLSGDGTTQLVTMTADDGNGNSTTCSFTVTLDDTTDPVITVCPADASVTADASCMFTILDYTGGVTATDNCTAGGSITITQSPPAGTLVSGTQVVTMTADDGNGNTSTCSFTLTVDDTTDPVITVCQSNVTVTVDASCEYDIADYTGAVTATDNCTASGALVVTQSPAIGTTLTGDGTTQTVTMTVADANGNTSTCSFVITLDDTIDPVITVCPSDATLIVDASCDVSLPDYTGSTTATDNCTASGSITITQSPVAGTTLSGDGTTQLVTMTADDGNGNSTTCSFTVTLDDTTDPVITVCPSDATLIVDASCDISLPDYTGSTTATDNCTASGSITITQSPVAGTTLSGEGTTQLVTMTADDGNGNSTTCSFTVTLDDTTDPVITVCPPDATLIVDGSCDVSLPDYTGSTTATDNCTASGSITITQSPVAGTTLSGDGTTQLVTMTADDGNGNSTTCSFTVTLDDTTDPVITVCPPDATLIVDGSCDVSLPDYTGSTTATDNCTASGSITITQSPVAGTTLSGDGTTQLVTMTADDGNGNSTTCSFTVTLDDTTDPVITVCPSDATLIVDASCDVSLPDYTGSTTATDNCTASGSITITQSPVAGTTLSGEGTTQLVTMTADDGNGNSTTCSFTVTLDDTTDPVITVCPSDATLIVDGSCDVSLPDYTGSTTATDNCTASGSITITQSPVAGTTLSGDGTTQLVTMTADDGNGNSTTCSFTVTLDDTTDPVITVCPADASVTADASCMFTILDYTGGVTATDNCTAGGSITITQSPPAGTLVSGTQVVTMTADDGNGNTSTCSFTLTVDDTTDPVITVCQSNVTVTVDASCEYDIADYTGAVTATDNCTASGALVVTQSPAIGTTLTGDGTTQTVTMTVADANGNTSTCSFVITLDDTIDPVITVCPSDATLIVDASCDVSLPDYTGSTTATDNCTASGSITITQSPVAGTTLSGDGTTQLVTMTADDGNGNSTTCSFTVTLDDTTDPVITVCPSDATLIVDASCDISLPDYTGSTTATDNCTASGSITITQSPVAGTTLSGEGTTQLVTMTADDGNGNSTTCSFTVTLEDTTDPVITVCPSDATLIVDGSCDVSLPDYTGSTTATDNCTASGSITITQSPVAGTTLSGDGTTQLVTMTADDGNGNSTTCSFTVTLDDTTDPVITVCPPDATLIVDGSCDVSLPDYTGSTTATDNCTASGSITITQSPVAGTTLSGDGTTQLVTMTADDGNGNSTTCSFTVTLDDTTDPVITVCPSDATLIVDASCDVSLPDYTGSTTATDNCTASGSITITQSPVAGTTLSGEGTTQLVTMTADDGNGNSTTCSFTVTLDDTTDPVITVCPSDATLIVDGSCDVSLPDYTGSTTATDNCTASGSITITQSPVAGTTLSGDGTTQLVTMTADDGNGNSTTCSFTVTLDDTTDPVITVCPADASVTADASCMFTILDYTGGVTATDNCTAGGSITITQSPPAGTLVSGTQVVTMTADDGNGNTSTCSFTLTVDDTTAPNISNCPIDVTETVDGSCEFEIPDYTGIPIVADNCTSLGALVVTQSPVATTTISGHGTTQTVTLTVADANGNTAQCSFVITLDDDTDPAITCPVDINTGVDAGECFATVTWLAPVGTDNCSVVSTTQTGGAPSGSTFAVGTHTIEYTTTDIAGNTAICTFDIIVTDGEDPVITTCPPNTTVSADASCGYLMPDYTGALVAEDNCTLVGALVISQSPLPGSAQTGTQTVTITVEDEAGNTTTCDLTVTVVDTTAPTISNCPVDVIENVDANCEFLIPDYTEIPTLADNCTAVGDLVVTQSPGPGTIMGDGFSQVVTLTVTDANSNTNQCSFTITLDDNTPPTIDVCQNDTTIIRNSCDYAIEDFTGFITASDNCSASGNILITQSPSSGMIIGEGATQVITITATDEDGLFTTCNFTITLDDGPEPNAGIGTTIDYCTVDPVANLFDSLTAFPEITGAWEPVLANGHLGTFDPGANPVGTYTFAYIVPAVGACTDPDTAVVIVNLANSGICNSPPVITMANDEADINDAIQGPTLTTNEDESFIICYTIEDPGGVGANIDFLASSAVNGALTATSDPLDTCMVYTPVGNFNGVDTILVTICDDFGLCDDAVVLVNVIPVNDDPIINGGQTDTLIITPEETAIELCLDLFDIDGDALDICQVFSGPGDGALTGVNSGDSCLTYIPDPLFNGTDNFCLEVCDGAGGTDTLCVEILVTPVNDPPIITDDMGVPIDEQNESTDEDTAIVICLDVFDVDGDATQVFSAVTLPVNGTISDLASGDDCFTYSPDQDYNGLDSVQIIVCDDGSPVLCDTAWVIIDVLPVNDDPVITGVDGVTPIDQQIEETPEETPIEICFDAYDVDGDTLDICEVFGGPDNGTLTFEFDGDTCLIYTPNDLFNGIDTMQVVVCDEFGGADTVEVIIGVPFVNDDPVIVDENGIPTDTLNYVTNEDTPITICVDVTDDDLDQTADVTAVPFPPSIGVIAGLNDGDTCFTYTPNPDLNGLDSLMIVVCDNNPIPGCDTAWVYIDVLPVNDDPVINGGQTDTLMTTPEETPIILCLEVFDVDGDTLDVCQILSPPSNGLLTGEFDGDTCLTYTPELDFNGIDNFCLEVCDGFGGTDTICVEMEVTPVNDIPILEGGGPVEVETPEDTPIVICLDLFDVDGDSLTLAEFLNGPANGIITGIPSLDSCFTYTPDTDWNGVDTVEIIFCDNGLPELCDTITVEITVTPVNDNPVILDGAMPADTLSETTPEDEPILVCLDLYDIDGDPVDITEVLVDPLNGDVTGLSDADSCFTYTSDLNWCGLDSMQVIACDPFGGCDTVWVLINVVCVNDVPIAVDDFEDVEGPITIDVQINDFDVENDNLTTTILSGPFGAGNTATVINGDSILFTPDIAFCGTDSILYQICDDGVPVLCDSAWVYLEITPVDSDQDGLADFYETLTADTDGDGVNDYLDLDSDNDGLSDALEAADVGDFCNPTPLDFDGDGVPDFVDLDSDNDGILDYTESNEGGFGPIGIDSDGDGIDDSYDEDQGGSMTDMPLDTDGDGNPDHLDLDSDNDGVGDVTENGGFDPDNDGVIGDGSQIDTDGDGILDDADEDQGGIDVTLDDTDGDGVPDSQDLDSDNDGISDVIEGGNADLDSDGDGIIDGEDTDNDGIIDAVDSQVGIYGGFDSELPGDFDGDGVFDMDDLDSDNDGISDIYESGNAEWDLDNDGIVDGVDLDGDGIIDQADSDDAVFGGFEDTDMTDSDNDGQPDHTDLDSDDDGIPDVIESGNGDLDADQDGQVDGEDTDGDGIIDTVDSDIGIFGGFNDVPVDSDGDGIEDYLDEDSDNDTVPDESENDPNGDGEGPDDTDMDGLPDYIDPDDDDDGELTIDEWDFDGDGIGPDDCDEDLTPDYLDPDPCDVIIPNGFSPNGIGPNETWEISGLEPYPDHNLVVMNRWGNKVFEASPYNNDWEGDNQFGISLGVDLPDGTYYYILELNDELGQVFKGWVYIKRK